MNTLPRINMEPDAFKRNMVQTRTPRTVRFHVSCWEGTYEWVYGGFITWSPLPGTPIFVLLVLILLRSLAVSKRINRGSSAGFFWAEIPLFGLWWISWTDLRVVRLGLFGKRWICTWDPRKLPRLRQSRATLVGRYNYLLQINMESNKEAATDSAQQGYLPSFVRNCKARTGLFSNTGHWQKHASCGFAQAVLPMAAGCLVWAVI